MIARILAAELDVLKIEKEIDTKVHESIQKSQKRFLLQEQVRILQDELGADLFEERTIRGDAKHDVHLRNSML